MIPVFILIYVALGLIAAIRPRIGAQLMWFAFWLYPVGLLHRLLPYGVRFDDLYMIWLTLCVIFSGGLRGRVPAVVTLSFLWFLSVVAGNLVGLATAEMPLGAAVLSRIGKESYMPMIAIILWGTTRSERDARGHLLAMVLAGAAAGVMGIVQVKAPDLVKMWEIPVYRYIRELPELSAYGEVYRRAGAALGIIYYGYTMMTLGLMCLRLTIHRTGTLMRVLGAVGLGIMVVGLAYSNTRSAIGGFLLATVYLLFRARRRFALIFLMGVGLAYLVAGTDLIERIERRIAGTGEGLGAAAAERTSIWRIYLVERPSAHYLFFGRGWEAERQRTGVSAHSGYIGTLAYTGLVGVVITTLLFWRAWRVADPLTRQPLTDFQRALGEGAKAIIIATLFASLFGEEIHAHQLRVIVGLGVICELLSRALVALRVAPRAPAVVPGLAAGVRLPAAPFAAGRP